MSSFFYFNLRNLLYLIAGAPPIDRVSVPVSDEAAVIQFYVCALKKNRRLFDSIEGRVAEIGGLVRGRSGEV